MWSYGILPGLVDGIYLPAAQAHTTQDSLVNQVITDDANGMVSAEIQGWYVLATLNGAVTTNHKLGKVLIRYEVERPRD